MKRSETAKVLKLIYDQQLVSRTELAKQAVRRALQTLEQARANTVPAGEKR